MAGAGGYDYEFLTTPPDRLVCKICHSPCRDTHLTNCCGAHFCRSCVQQVRRGRSVNRACPMCRAERFQTFPNKEVDREIKALQVYCVNEKNGCTWTGEVKHAKRHVDVDCQFVDMSCPSGCGMTLKRQCIDSHLAKDCPCHCQYCDFTGHKMEIAIRHKKRCSQYPLPCPNNCELGVVPTARMADHKKVCPLEIVPCEYSEMGCNVRLPRRDIEKHNTTETAHHLKLMNQAFVKMNKDLIKAKSAQELQYEEITDLRDHRMFSISIQMDRIKYTQMKRDEDMEEFQEQIMDAKTKQRNLLEYLNLHVNLFNMLFVVLFVALIVYAVWSTVMLFQSNNQLWRMSIRESSCLDMCTDGIAPVIMKMPNFTEIKSNKEWYSSPFLAFHSGYQMHLRVNVLHDSSLQLTLQLLKGPYDDELNHYFPLKMLASVELLNQAQDSFHYLVPFMLHTRCCGNCATRVERAVYPHPHAHANSLVIQQSVITKEDNFYFHNNQLNFRVSVLLIQGDYFLMTLCYYYLYIVGSADKKWMVFTFLIVFGASAVLYFVIYTYRQKKIEDDRRRQILARRFGVDHHFPYHYD